MLTDEQVERVAHYVENAPTHPPGDCREMVSRKLVRQILEAYQLQTTLDHGGDNGLIERIAEQVRGHHDESLPSFKAGDIRALLARIEQDRATIRELREAMAQAAVPLEGLLASRQWVDISPETWAEIENGVACVRAALTKEA